MSINFISNSHYILEETIEPNLVSILFENRFDLFGKICSYLKPLDMQAFLLAYKTPRLIHENLKENDKITYKALMTRIFSNSFSNKSVEELSKDIVNFCQKGKFSQLKELLQSLKICNKFHEISVKTLDKAFSLSCMYNHANIVQLFINSGRFHEISLNSLNQSFRLGARDDGMTIQILINSDRFHEISQMSLGDALINGHPGVVKAIINSTRACEISVNDLEKTLKNVAGNGYTGKNNHLESLRHLINSPRYQEISSDCLEKVLISACNNWRHDAVQEFGKSTRFNEISSECLNKSFRLSLRNFELLSVKVFIESTRFNEIDPTYLKEAYRLASFKPELMELLKKSGRTV